MGCWMSSNRLKLNASKTEFIWLGSTRRLVRCTFDPIIINGDTILPSRTVRDLGAYIDSGINLDEHVARLTRACFFQIRQLRSIRRSLTVESSHALVRALVRTRLDYCNGLFGGAPKCPLGPLSGVLGAAARLILLLLRSGSVTDRIRTELHWLDIPSRVTFKLCILAYRCIHGSAPSYLARFFTPVTCNRRTLTTAIWGGRCVVCAEVTHFDNWSAGFCHFLPLCLEQPSGWSSWSRPLSSFIPEKNWRLICLMCLFIITCFTFVCCLFMLWCFVNHWRLLWQFFEKPIC